MRIFGVGDLVCDLYYQDSKLVGCDGGKSFANILVNLADTFPTYLWGTVGEDIYGDIALQSLRDLHVNTKYVRREKVSTRLFYIDIDKGITQKRNFETKEKTWYPKSLVNPNISSILKEDDILIFDSINETNQKIMNSTKVRKMLDIGYEKELFAYTDQELISFFQQRFTILNLNGRVEKYLLSRFHTLDILHADFIIITYGKRGAKFLFSNQEYVKELNVTQKEVDANGLGDLFFSCFLRMYLQENRIDKNLIDKTFLEATKKTTLLATKIGARGHLHSLYSLDSNFKEKELL